MEKKDIHSVMAAQMACRLFTPEQFAALAFEVSADMRVAQRDRCLEGSHGCPTHSKWICECISCVRWETSHDNNDRKSCQEPRAPDDDGECLCVSGKTFPCSKHNTSTEDEGSAFCRRINANRDALSCCPCDGCKFRLHVAYDLKENLHDASVNAFIEHFNAAHNGNFSLLRRKNLGNKFALGIK